MASKGVTIEDDIVGGFGNPGVSGILHQKSSRDAMLDHNASGYSQVLRITEENKVKLTIEEFTSSVDTANVDFKAYIIDKVKLLKNKDEKELVMQVRRHFTHSYFNC